MGKVNLSAPWEIFYKELSALFEDDPEIEIVYDENSKVINMRVDNVVKADALTQLLPEGAQFGNVELKIRVIPGNEESTVSLFEKAFWGNPAFAYAEKTEGAFNRNYVVFANKVVQYYADNLADINRNNSTLYEEIARHVFRDQPDVSFCTAAADSLVIADPEDMISLI